MIKSENVLWPRDNCAAQKPPASDSIPSPAPANSTIFLIAFLNARFLCLCTKYNPVLWEFSRANKMMSFAPGPTTRRTRLIKRYSQPLPHPGQSPDIAAVVRHLRILAASRKGATRLFLRSPLK